MPSMAHGDWELFGKSFFNYHKGQFGVKAELAVAMQRRPIPLFCSVAPAGMNDLTIARQAGDVFSTLKPGEIGLGDPGYVGQPDRIYAPPRKNMRSYVAEDDKAELTLQRRVEMANQIMKRFKVLGTIYRKGAVHAFEDLKLIVSVVAKLVFWDLFLNQEHGGAIHTSGPVPDPVVKQKRSSLFGLGAKNKVRGRESKNVRVQGRVGKRERRRIPVVIKRTKRTK